MITDTNFQFLQNKLEELKNAVMYTMSNNIKRLPNDIVVFHKIDEEGRIWLTAHKPRRWIRSYEHCFPARLFFYRKNADFYIEIGGTIRFASKKEVMCNGDELNNNSLLLKITPHFIDYTEVGKKSFLPSLSRVWSKFYSLLTEMLPLNHAGELSKI